MINDDETSVKGRELEVRAQLVLQRYYGCTVELSPPGPDVGRDLIVRHPDGAIVVECKEWSDKRAGRELVQKLHSATRTMDSRRALLICTSGFTPQARSYAADLEDVQIELWDGGRFEALAASVGLTADGDAAAQAQLIPPPDQFKRILTMGVLAPRAGRFASVTAVDRHVEWVALYVAAYRAEGHETRTNRSFQRSWTGTVWLDPRTHEVRTGPLPNIGAPLAPAAAVIGDGPTSTVTPTTTHGRANEVMRSYLLGNLAHTEHYTGGNNQRYSVTVTPKPSLTALAPIQTTYVPVQQLRVTGPAGVWTSQFSQLHDADGRLTGLSMSSEHLTTCATCNGTLTSSSHQVCAVCHRGLHAPLLGVLRRHGNQCTRCNGNTCPDHTVIGAGGKTYCVTCAPSEEPARRRHLLMPGISAAVGIVIAIVAAMLGFVEVAILVAAISLVPAAVEAAATMSRSNAEISYALPGPIHLTHPKAQQPPPHQRRQRGPPPPHPNASQATRSEPPPPQQMPPPASSSQPLDTAGGQPPPPPPTH